MTIPWESLSTVGFAGFILLLAITFSVSTVPIISVILLLISKKHPIRKATGFLVGHYLGILLVAVGSYLLIQNFPPVTIDRNDSTFNIILSIILGLILLIIASKMWKSRSIAKPSKSKTKILNSLESLTFFKCLAVAFLLMITGFKNWILIYVTTKALLIVDLGVKTEIAILILFLIISGITLFIPMIISIIFGKRIQPTLIKLQAWLTRNSNTVIAIALFLAGIFILLKNLLGFLR